MEEVKSMHPVVLKISHSLIQNKCELRAHPSELQISQPPSEGRKEDKRHIAFDKIMAVLNHLRLKRPW